MVWSLLYRKTSLKCSKDFGKALRRRRGLSSSSSFFFNIFQVIKNLVKSSCYSVINLDSVILKEYNCCFKQSLFTKLFVIYKDSNLTHILAAVFSLVTSLGAISPRDKIMALLSLFIILFFFFFVIEWETCVSPPSKLLCILVAPRWLASWSSITQNHYFQKTSRYRTWYPWFTFLVFLISFLSSL